MSQISNISAGEIDKKQSTVQKASDTIKGENFSAQSQFVKAHETEKGKQHLFSQETSQGEIDKKLAELRWRTG